MDELKALKEMEDTKKEFERSIIEIYRSGIRLMNQIERRWNKENPQPDGRSGVCALYGTRPYIAICKPEDVKEARRRIQERYLEEIMQGIGEVFKK